MTDLEEFIEIERDPSRIPAPDLIDRLAAEYPFYTAPAVLMIQRGRSILEPELIRRFSEIIALNSPDHTLLFTLSSDEGQGASDIEAYESDAIETPATEDAIDTFLRQYGNVSDEENALLERLIFNPIPDYASQLALDEQCAADASAIDLESQPLAELARNINSTTDDSKSDIAPVPPTPPARHSENRDTTLHDTTLSESLAKIYIKQHRFDKALEIISGLYLKFPEKSVYFADQMRFLRKLILNRNFNSQK